MRLLFTDVLASSYIGASEETLASLGRIYQHYLASGDKSFCIMTSWKGSYSKEVNLKNLEKFKQLLRSNQLGFMEMKGKWKNDRDEIESEPSFFIPRISLSLAKKLQEEFDQDAIVYAGPETEGKVFLYLSDGSGQDLGKFHPKKIGDVFSEIRGKPFTFAGVALGFLDAVLASKAIDDNQINRTREKLKKVEQSFQG